MGNDFRARHFKKTWPKQLDLNASPLQDSGCLLALLCTHWRRRRVKTSRDHTQALNQQQQTLLTAPARPWHRSTLLWQQSNLLVWRFVYQWLLSLIRSPSGTCKPPGTECTAFDYTRPVRKMLIGHYIECKWGWRSHILRNQWISFHGFVICGKDRPMHSVVAFMFIHMKLQHACFLSNKTECGLWSS